MFIDQISDSLKNSQLTFPFDETTRVYKVENKMYMIVPSDYSSVSLKNSPDKNYFLRSSYDYIKPGYHLNKEHWITIDLTQSFDQVLVESLIQESYAIIINKLPKKIKQQYADVLGIEFK